MVKADMQRVFIGIPVDQQSQLRINELLRPIKKLHQDVRWEPDSNWHLTLAFIGNTPVAEVDNLLQLFGDTYQQEQRFEFRLSTMTRFPGPSGRIVALVNDPTEPLHKLFQITKTFLERNNVDLDLKQFRPHITLGRIKKAKHVKTNFDQKTDISLKVKKITFYQCTQGESGSIYTAIIETWLN